MKGQNFKKVVSLVAGSLVVALVVSVLPGNFLVNAAEVSRTEARKFALEEFDDETAEVTRVKSNLDDEDEPYYIVMVKTDDDEFEVIVSAENGYAQIVSEDELTMIEAKRLARAEIEDEYDDDTAQVTGVNIKHLNEDNPYYIVIVETEEDEYVVKVFVNGDIEIVTENEVGLVEAKKLAVAKIKKEIDDVETAKVIGVNDSHLNDDDPYYIMTVEINDDNDDVYKVKVFTLDGYVEIVSEEGLTRGEAKELAIEAVLKEIDKDIDEEDIDTTIDDDHANDRRNPYYTIIVEIEDEEFEVKVYLDARVELITEEEESKSKEDKIPEEFKDIDDLDDFNDYLEDYDVEDDDYANYNKPTEQAELNMFLRDAKKYAKSEFDKEELKAAKDSIKTARKPEVKEVEKETTEKVNENLVKSVKLSKEQALLKALRKMGISVESVELDDIEDELEDKFNLKVKSIKLEDSNPQAYLITFEYKGNEYEIKVHATYGTILNYDSELMETEEAEDNDSKDTDKVEEKSNNGNKDNNGKKKK